MQTRGFDQYIEGAVARDPRYAPEGYVFLREALDYTIKHVRKSGKKAGQHVRGPELLDGFRQLALDHFGPLARVVLEEWGVRATEDVGHMVFNLVAVGAFGRTKEDNIDDFRGCYDFEEAFDAPFRPGKRQGAGRKA